jgi:hypothetical protein
MKRHYAGLYVSLFSSRFRVFMHKTPLLKKFTRQGLKDKGLTILKYCVLFILFVLLLDIVYLFIRTLGMKAITGH